MSNFSDPEWWPRRPLPAPKRISLGAALLGGMVPLVVGAAIVLLIVSGRHPHTGSDRTIAAYTACLHAHGGTSATAAERPQAVADCASLKPSGLPPDAGGIGERQPPPDSAQALFRSCLEQALAASGGAHGGSGHDGRGPGGPSSAFRAAELVCASVAGGASGHGLPVGPSATSTTPPKL